jgi:molybdopterin-guanine dinucleotide biosynthesis protein A
MNAIILAGGLSRRMNGTRKAFLRLGDETFLERILGVLGPFVDSFLIVTNEPDRYAGFGAQVVRDEREGVGPLMGICSGLKASQAETSFVTAVDTPLLAPGLVRHLAEDGDDCDARVPRWHGDMQPLCAVYSSRCLPAIEHVLDQERAGEDVSPGTGPRTGPRGRIIAFFPLVRVCIVEEPAVRKLDPEGISFFNVNTFKDYESLRSLATDGGR